jgi:hypothetical protein
MLLTKPSAPKEEIQAVIPAFAGFRLLSCYLMIAVLTLQQKGKSNE